MSRTLLAIAFAALLAVVAACASASPPKSAPVSGTQTNLFPATAVLASATVPALTPAEQYNVLLGNNSIQPMNLTLPDGKYVRIQITDTGGDCKFSVGSYVGGLLVSNTTPGEVTFDVSSTPIAATPTSTPTALAPQSIPSAAPPTVTLSSPAAQAAVPRVAPSPTGIAAPASGNAPPNPALMGCNGDITRSAALLVAATPSNPGVTQSSPLPATAVASVIQVGLLLQPNAVQPAQLGLPIDQVVHVVVDNRGPACRFMLGPFLQGLSIPANGSADFTFRSSPSSIATPVASSGAAAGCAGDPARQVQLVLPAQSAG